MRSYARDQFRSGRFRDELAEFLSIPSISQEPEHLDDVRTAAGFVESYLRGMGARARTVNAGDFPLVYGSLEGKKGAPTLLIYGHVDVQPYEKQRPRWKSDPIVLTEIDGQWVARGIVDNKGPLWAEIKAVEGARAEGSGLNYDFVVEGQEEIGSRDFEAGLAQVRDDISPDSILVVDGNWIDWDRPAITTSLRGLLHLKFKYTSVDRDLHAGTWGNFPENAMEALDGTLLHLGDTIRNHGGFVTRNVDPDILASYPLSFDDLVKQSGARKTRFPDRDVRYANFKRWYQPSFEMVDRSPGAGSSAIPGSAWVDVNLRVPPGVDPNEVYSEVVRLSSVLLPGVEVENHGTLNPFVTSTKGPSIETAKTSFERGFRKNVFLTGEGASIGALSVMRDAYPETDFVITGLTVPGVMHSENEYARPDILEDGIVSLGEYYLDLEKALRKQ